MTLHAHLEEDEHGAIRQVSFSTPNSSSTQHTAPSAAASTSAQTNALAPAPDRLTPLDQANELELVNEIVEQAFVDNLFNGAFYSQTNSTANTMATRTIQISNNSSNNNSNNNNNENQTSRGTNPLQANEINNGVRSGSGQVDLSIGTGSYSVTNNSNHLNEERLNVQDGHVTTRNDVSNENSINILIRFVNEKEMRIKAKPTDTILFLKK
jgi:hypothetical protein